ncbi:MAG: YicC family protein [Halieaceae bacterium]|nr:YicC family protein [Halieaceae bacterium]
MIHSMTGFGRAEADQQGSSIQVEIRSVNQRHLDIYLRLPETLNSLEAKIREQVKQTLARGKVDIGIRLGTATDSESALTIHQSKLEGLLTLLQTIAERAGDTVAKANALDILQWDGVLEKQRVGIEQIEPVLMGCLTEALALLTESRQREGASLATTLQERVSDIRAQIERINSAYPAAREGYHTRLRQKLEDTAINIDEQRLAQELVIFAQKSDLEEELDRLNVHLNEMLRILAEGGPCGRKLDFLMQELNREANTIASKSIHTDITQAAVEMKVLIEQMREQIQNIE